MDLFIWSSLTLTFVIWLGGWAVMARLRRVPKTERGAPKPGVKISIIIPARDEEENLSRLLPSISAQEFAPHEIIVVDDQSTDGTAKVAAENGAHVIPGQPLPDGWFGKPWACQQGADAATGEWLFFLDADTELETEALIDIGDLARDTKSVHSICPWHRVERPYEQLSAFFNVIMLLGMNAFTLKGNSARGIGLFGQAMFISREQYDTVGGHRKVRREVLENFKLSQYLANAGFNCRCYLGKGTVKMRMFPGGFGHLVAGWSKGFISGAGYTPRSAMIGISAWLSGLIMMTISLTFLPLASAAAAKVIAILYGLGVAQSLFLFRRAGGFWFVSALLFPIGLVFYQAVFFRALVRKKSGGTVQWKGRDVS